ncbi:MAG: glucokinase [Microgenomates group bacterium Gr01-1014_16]|nr:MAG: glucokinase [Microgenomates group bacterium Gr01-1014_16]
MFVVFDIGGSKMRVGSVAGSKLTEVKVEETPQNYEFGIGRLAEMVGKPERLAGGIAGRWNREKTQLIGSRNLRDWENRQIKKDLEKMSGSEVILENDAVIGGLGEAKYGAGKNYDIVAYLVFGTGVGGARIVNKKLDVNYDGFEPGTMIVDYPQSLEDKVKERNNVEKWLEVAVVNVKAMWSPEIIIIGGGLGLNLELPKNPMVVKAELGDQAGLWGGLALLEK